MTARLAMVSVTLGLYVAKLIMPSPSLVNILTHALWQYEHRLQLAACRPSDLTQNIYEHSCETSTLQPSVRLDFCSFSGPYGFTGQKVSLGNTIIIRRKRDGSSEMAAK